MYAYVTEVSEEANSHPVKSPGVGVGGLFEPPAMVLGIDLGHLQELCVLSLTEPSLDLFFVRVSSPVLF